MGGRLSLALALGGLIWAAASPALALDQKQTTAAPLGAGPVEAFHSGAQAYQSGDKVAALRALEMAAAQGHAAAQWKIARMYADGDGVSADSIKAFELFQQLASEHAEANPRGRYAGVIANAFVSLGSYYIDGIDGRVEPDSEQAMSLFFHAASYFGDPDAQFHLGRIYLDGSLTERDPRQAARWLDLAAGEGHRDAQLVLGQLLFQGDGVRRRPVNGLAWLLIACEQAVGPQRTLTQPVCDTAVSEASEKQYTRARKKAADWHTRHNGKSGIKPQS